MLKKAVGMHPSAPSIPTALTFDMEMIVEPESVLGIRSSTASRGGLEVLIHWKGLPSFDDTWEDYETIEKQFP